MGLEPPPPDPQVAPSPHFTWVKQPNKTMAKRPPVEKQGRELFNNR